MRYAITFLLLPFLTLSYMPALSAEYTDEEALELEYPRVSIATGTPQPLYRAPAAATVITAQDIEAIGATDLGEVLETVPGLHVSTAGGGYYPIYSIRGINSEFQPQILVLLNGIPLTNFYTGNLGLGWGGMPVKAISRVEVIRGPGSAVYGADAFAGVINIITKSAQEIQGTEFGVRGGSFNTRAGWLLHGSQWGGWDVGFSMQVEGVDGAARTVDADLQTEIDSALGTTASLAPGSINDWADRLDSRLELSRDAWTLRAGYQYRRIGTGVGVAQALDPGGRIESRRFNADISYKFDVGRDWLFTGQLSYYDLETRFELMLFPPGAFNNAFADGVIGNPSQYERHTRTELTALYTGARSHQLRLGTGFHYGDLYKIGETKNFFINTDNNITPLGSLVDVSDNEALVFMRPQDRWIRYAFLQDEWQFATDWTLTAGLRYDEYSDFGTTVNPRLALIWEMNYNLTSKFLYGRAFRPPSFQELYNINNPISVGNPDLDPETIDTIEVAVDYRPRFDLNTRLNLFYYEMDDIIRFLPNVDSSTTAINAGSQHGHGGEVEIEWRPTPRLRLLGNYAYQRADTVGVETEVGNAPRHQAYGRIEWKANHLWDVNAQANWVGGRTRRADDPRQDIDDYATVDFTIHRSADPWNLTLSVRNVFDADVREPSFSAIPKDIPLAGRWFYLGAKVHW
ncbi:TonB-dependent receptor plug domain-containing protein [Sulfuriflexus mobilis]|uniref:TonB-dependent receptor plug domain-containing protein n=1 Tax=Sulfuriflexus mobilis TaxID=1811807 RepID=UPI000F82F3CC|nr:TonB-dependent receptor [Sulfuriflexus mobilis]